MANRVEVLLEDLVGKLRALKSHLMPELHDHVDELVVQAKQVKTLAEQDAVKVEADAETAAKPVVAEAVKAGEQVAAQAIADVTKF